MRKTIGRSKNLGYNDRNQNEDKKLKSWLKFILICMFLGALISFCTVNIHHIYRDRVEGYKSGRLVDIGEQTWTVSKKTLTNGKCYYLYQWGRTVFTIPCEE